MTEMSSSPVSMNQCMQQLSHIVYGRFRFTPEQVGCLNFFDVDEMNRGYEENLELCRWEKAHWVSCIINPQLEHAVTAKQLMAPFLPEKTRSEMLEEKQQIIKEFNLERE